jgi:hypothetical protein
MSPVDELSRNSPFLLNENDDPLKICDDRVDNQLAEMEAKKEDNRLVQKRKQTPPHEEQCDSPDENDDADSIVSSTCGKKRRRKAVKLKDEQLDLQCEWRDCNYVNGSLDQFVRHVSLHIPHLEVKVNEDQEGNSSVLFPRILPAYNSVILLAHKICSLFKYHRRMYWFENRKRKHGK